MRTSLFSDTLFETSRYAKEPSTTSSHTRQCSGINGLFLARQYPRTAERDRARSYSIQRPNLAFPTAGKCREFTARSGSLCPQPKNNGWNRNAPTLRQLSRKAAGKFTGKVARPNCLVYVRPLCHRALRRSESNARAFKHNECAKKSEKGLARCPVCSALAALLIRLSTISIYFRCCSHKGKQATACSLTRSNTTTFQPMPPALTASMLSHAAQAAWFNNGFRRNDCWCRSSGLVRGTRITSGGNGE